MTCAATTAPISNDLVRSQMQTIIDRGGETYLTAMEALNSLQETFTTHITGTENGVSGVFGSSGSGLVDRYPVNTLDFVKPDPITVPTDSSKLAFTVPPVPDLTDAHDRKIDIDLLLTQLRALLISRPTFAGISVEDRFLEMLNQYYSIVRSRLDAILSGCAATAALCPTLAEWMGTSSVGMPEPVEEALRLRGFAALRATAQQAERAVLADWQARGFTLPGGLLDARVQQVRQVERDDRQKLIRDILIESAKWERETRQFAVEKALVFYQLQQDGELKAHELATKIAETWQANAIKVALAVVEVYKAEVEAWAAAMRAVGDGLDAMIALQKYDLDAWLGEVELFKARLTAESTRFDGNIKLFGLATDVYQADGKMESERSNSEIRQIELSLKKMQVEGDLDLKNKQIEVERLLSVTKITADVLSHVASTAAQLSAGLNAAVSVRAGVSVEHQSQSSSSCSEQYQYQYITQTTEQ